MATIKFINSKGNLKRIIDYVTQDEKTDATLISGKDCMSSNALLEMEMVKSLFNKHGGRTYLHVIQSFDPNDRLSHHEANEIGLKTAEKFKGYQVLVVTHKDREHIHNHLVINTVSFEDGKKLHQNKHDLQRIKDFSDILCTAYNLSVVKHKTQTTDIKQAEYQQALKGTSWKFQLMNSIDYAMENSKNKNEFITKMQELGYDVQWTDTRKYITYTTPEGEKCRDIKLHDPKYLKEKMENEFREIKAEKSSCDSRAYEQSNDTGSFRKVVYDMGIDRATTDGTNTKENNQHRLSDRENFGTTEGNIHGAPEGNEQADREFGETAKSKSNRAMAREENQVSQESRGRVSVGDSILDSGLLLAGSLADDDRRRDARYQSRELSKQAKKEYAIKQESKGLGWEEEDEWEI